MKHIEQLLPEYAADDMTALLLSDATASAALSRLLHDWTGCAIPPTSDTPQSEVEELVPLCLSILRRHWTTPLTALGDGTTPMSLADLMRRLILGRVDGNEALGIPPANANIPTAVSQLLDRKIGGVPEAPDGISLVQLLGSTEAKDSVTELVDDNEGWTIYKAFPSVFTNLKKVRSKCKEIICRTSDYPYGVMTVFGNLDELDLQEVEYIGMEKDRDYRFTNYGALLTSSLSSEEVVVPKLKRLYNSTGANLFGSLPNAKRVVLPSLQDIRTCGSSWLGKGTGTQCLANAPECLELITAIEGNTNANNESADYKFIIAPKLRKFIIGGVLAVRNDKGLFNTTSTDLVHLEIGGATCNLYMNEWNPTNALDASRTDLIEEGSTAANNLEQFLSNFKTYIANRLTDKGSGLTLTLSQAVRDAIQQDPDIVNIITSKGWTISPAPSV